MKLIMCLLIIFCFGIAGYLFKQKQILTLKFLKFLADFENFYDSNINLFKCNVIEIIDNYKITQKNKNENFINLFQKNSNIYSFDKEILKKYLNNDSAIVIENYLVSIGKNEYYYECEKNKKLKQYLAEQIKIAERNVDVKGSLTFKILLAIGAVFAILLW